MGHWKKPKTRSSSKPVPSIIDRELEMLYAVSETANKEEQKVIQEKIEILKR